MPKVRILSIGKASIQWPSPALRLYSLTVEVVFYGVTAGKWGLGLLKKVTP